MLGYGKIRNMKNNFTIFISATLIAIALVVAAKIMRPQIHREVQKEVVTKERETYRFQFIKSDMYKQFTVFDRKTGIVYQYGKSNENEVSLAIDLPNAGMSFKPFSDFNRTSIHSDD